MMLTTTTRETEAVTDARAATLEAADVDRELEAAIEPWLEHMRWRADFRSWREGRLWQEKRQKGTLNNLRAFLRAASRSNVNGDARAAEVTQTDNVLAGRLVLDLGCGMGGL